MIVSNQSNNSTPTNKSAVTFNKSNAATKNVESRQNNENLNQASVAKSNANNTQATTSVDQTSNHQSTKSIYPNTDVSSSAVKANVPTTQSNSSNSNVMNHPGQNDNNQASQIVGTADKPQDRPETVTNSARSYHPHGDVVKKIPQIPQQNFAVKQDNAVETFNLAATIVSNRSLGVDVSGYQGTNMTPYAQDGAKFAVVKLSEGTSYYNPNAAGQIKSAEQNGMMVMGYHFARFGSSTSEADQEAKHAIANAQLYGLPKGAYLACDYEQGCGAGSNVTANTNAVVEFMRKVQQAGYIPLLYSGAYYMQSKLNLNTITSQFGNCLWVASYATTAPVTGPNFNYFPSINHVIIWQFSDNWHGVDGDVCVMPLESSQTTSNTSNNQSSSSSSANTNNEPTWTDNLGKVWHKETGIFTVGSTPLHLRWGATTSSTIITTLQPGQQIKYDAWMNDGTYTWVRQPRGNGTYGYVAVRDKSGPFGTFSDVPSSNNSQNNNSNKNTNNNQSNNNKPVNNTISTNSDAHYTGQKLVNGKWQYWNNGQPVKNTYEWLPDEKKETYYDGNGNMVYGQQQINGHWQYFDPTTGAQAKNQYVWLPDDKKEVYYDGNGNMVYGWQTINGQKRYFDPTTGAQAKSCTLNINNQKWSFDNQGNPTEINSTTSNSGSDASISPATSGNKGTDISDSNAKPSANSSNTSIANKNVPNSTNTGSANINNKLTMNGNTTNSNSSKTSSTEQPIKVTIHYVGQDGKAVGTVIDTIQPGSTLNVSKNVPKGYEVSSAFKPQTGVQAHNDQATLNVLVVPVGQKNKVDSKINTQKNQTNNSSKNQAQASNDDSKKSEQSNNAKNGELLKNAQEQKNNNQIPANADANNASKATANSGNTGKAISSSAPTFNVAANSKRAVSMIQSSNASASQNSVSATSPVQSNAAMSSSRASSANTLPETGMENNGIEFAAAALAIAGSLALKKRNKKD